MFRGFSRRRFSSLAGLIVIVGFVASGCAGTASIPGQSGAYHSEFEQAKAGDNSPYVIEMLADDQITDAEFAEAQAMVVSCLKKRGWDATWAPNDVGQLDQLSIATYSDMSVTSPDVIDCKAQWLGAAEWLYWSIKNNPNNEDFNGLIAACLVRSGFAPRGFTGKDLDELMAQSSTTSESESGQGDLQIEQFEDSEGSGPLLPDGSELYRPETMLCIMTPLAVK